MKLYEAFSPVDGAKFKLTVGSETKELTLKRFDLGLMIKFESEGVSVDNLMQKLQENPATYGTMIAWELLIEKEEFKGSLDTFRSVLDLSSLQIIGEAITKAIENSSPKNEQRVEPKKGTPKAK